MNNKGQTLILFVLLIPLIFITLLIVIEFSKIYLDKQKTINIVKDTIEYGLKNIKEEKINEKLNNLIDANIKYEDKTIFISEDEIRINITKEQKIFKKIYNIKYTYKGIIKENKIIIEEG